MKPSVLIIEDDPIIADYLRIFLESNDYKVLGVAHTGESALDKISTLIPDLCICDIHLGTGMSGLELAEIIHTKYQKPYIFLTSFDDDHTMSEAEKHSPYGYIVKPFQDRTLLATIKIAWSNYIKQKDSEVLTKEALEEKISNSLSDQQFEILKALLKGESYKKIADNQYLTTDSIKYHAGQLYRKCGVSNRSELAHRLM